MTVGIPSCGTNLGDASHRTGQRFPTRNGHSEQDDGRAGLEIGQAISPFLSNQQKGLKFTPKSWRSCPDHNPLKVRPLNLFCQVYYNTKTIISNEEIDLGTNCSNPYFLILATWLLLFHPLPATDHCSRKVPLFPPSGCISLTPGTSISASFPHSLQASPSYF